MPVEVEVKARCSDPRSIVEKLMGMGARHAADLRQRDTYFRSPHRDFGTTDEALRIRAETVRVVPGGKGLGEGPPGPAYRHYLTYKGPKMDALTKTREELEIPIADPEAMRLVLTRLGFEVVMEIDKSRRVFQLGEMEVALDEVEGLGHFVEVEYASEGLKDVEGPKGEVLALLQRLGLTDTLRASYLELLLEARGPENP